MDKVTFLDGFRTFLHKFNGIGISDVVITTGVSNFPHIGWSATSMTNSDTQVESFCNILQDSFLMQMNRLVARPSSTTDNRSTGRILHLILTNHQALIALYLQGQEATIQLIFLLLLPSRAVSEG